MHELKFGIDIHSAREAFGFAASKKNIIPSGIHIHIGSQITDLDVFKEAAESTVAFIKELQSDGIALEHLNFGGGQGIQYKNVVRHTMLPAEADDTSKQTPQLPEYMKTVLPILSGTGLRLLFEPGRAVVANSGAMLAEVLYRKSNEKKTFVIVDAAMNDLIRPSLYGGYHQIAPLALSGKESEVVDVVGPICESTDFLAKGRNLPKLEQGDRIAVLCTGAYGFVMSSNYNMRPRAAEVMVDGNKHFLIRRRETIEELLG
jgi:diaminopimelate decarboxylase